MSLPDALQPILDRIALRQQTDADMAGLRQYLSSGGQAVSQQGKYAVNLGQGQDIQVGDRIYQGADAETIREIFRTLLQELKLPPQAVISPPAAIADLVQQVRLRLHDDIQRLHGTMPLWGVDHWVPLGELFVDVNILEEVSSNRRSELADLWQDFSQNPGYRSLDRMGLGKERLRVSGLEVLGRNTNLMVVGKPGSGKTTYLQRVVTECNAGNLQAHRIPVLIRLREFVEDGRGVDYAMERYLERCWRLSVVEVQLVLEAGRSLVLLDGLDEVTGTDGQAIAKQIKRFARDYPQVQVIVTCRTQSQESRFERFDAVEVADFNEPQVRAFAEHWFQTVCGDLTVGQAKASAFLEQLFREENKPIRELAITPILLSLTCAVFQQKQAFYSKRSKLYEEGLELLLEQWDKSREIERDEIYRDLSVERKLELLSYLAVKKFEQEQYVLFEQAEIEGYIAEFLGIGLRESRGVLRAIEAQHGLLIERSQKIWSFSHLIFQEYLVAKWFCKADFQVLADHFQQPHWREIFLITSEMVETTQKADELMNLFKQKVDFLLYSNEESQELIEWIKQRAENLQCIFKPAAIRGFYLSLILYLSQRMSFFDHELPSLIDYRVSRRQDALLCPNLKTDRDLANLLHIVLGNNSAGIARVRLAVLESDYSFEEESLTQDFQHLRSQLCNARGFDLNKFWKWWELHGQNWTQKLKDIIMRYRDIDYDRWRSLSHESLISLRNYYNTNKLLITCLNTCYIVSGELRWEIEETLLLPIVEIEKRNREKAE